jgi:hypothetical protein
MFFVYFAAFYARLAHRLELLDGSCESGGTILLLSCKTKDVEPHVGTVVHERIQVE